MKNSVVKALLAGVLLASGPLAFAGAGANVSVCLNLAEQPRQSYIVTVTPGNSGNSQCMYDYGNATTINVTQAGLNCGSVGYIEAKSSSSKGDLCATEASYWQIAYSTPSGGGGGGASGSATVNVTTSNTGSNGASLANQQTSTNMCASQGTCSGTSVSWPHGNVGSLYVIFVPGGH